MSNSESCPLIPWNFPRAQRTRRPPQPLAFVGNYLRRRGKCCAFFRSTLVGTSARFFFGFSPGSAGVKFSSCQDWFPAIFIGNFSGANFCFKVSFSALRVLLWFRHVFSVFLPEMFSCRESGFCNHLLFQRSLSLSLVSVTSSCRVCGSGLPGRPMQKAFSRVSSQG